MAIEFTCPACRGTLRVADESAGNMVRCGNCMSTLRVPVPPDGEQSSPAPEDDPFPRRRAAVEPVEPPEATSREATEDFGEPRPRRRRRRPAPASGHSALFWVMMVLLIVGLITAAACGGLFLVLQPKWRTHNSPQGGYKVELPAEARSDMEDMVRANGGIAQNVRVEGTILIVKLEEYSVVYADIEEGVRRKSNEDILDDAVDGIMADDPGVKVVRKNPATVSGFPARDIAFVHPEGGTYVCRIVVAGSRLYMVTAGGPNVSAAGNERTRRFLESFEITDPQLIAKQKERRANQQLVDQGVKRARERMRRQNRIED